MIFLDKKNLKNEVTLSRGRIHQHHPHVVSSLKESHIWRNRVLVSFNNIGPFDLVYWGCSTPPGNSHQQKTRDIFRLRDPELNLYLPLSLGRGLHPMILFTYQLIIHRYQVFNNILKLHPFWNAAAQQHFSLLTCAARGLSFDSWVMKRLEVGKQNSTVPSQTTHL